MMRILGIDIGGTNIRMGLVNEALTLTDFRHMNCQELLRVDAVSNLTNTIREYLQSVDAGDVAAISIGIPGQVSRDKSYI